MYTVDVSTKQCQWGKENSMLSTGYSILSPKNIYIKK